MPSFWGEKSIGFILESNRLLGRSFHFLKAVKPIAASPTTTATTMIAIRVVLLIPDVVVELLEDATDGVEDADDLLVGETRPC